MCLLALTRHLHFCDNTRPVMSAAWALAVSELQFTTYPGLLQTVRFQDEKGSSSKLASRARWRGGVGRGRGVLITFKRLPLVTVKGHMHARECVRVCVCCVCVVCVCVGVGVGVASR